MRKLFLLALAVVTLVLSSAAPVGADPAGGVKPACADIIGDLPTYNTTDAPNTVQGGIRTADPTCRGFRYTVVVSYLQGGQQHFAFFTDMGGNDLVVPNADESGVNGLIKFRLRRVLLDSRVTPLRRRTGPGRVHRAADAGNRVWGIHDRMDADPRRIARRIVPVQLTTQQPTPEPAPCRRGLDRLRRPCATHLRRA
jgi:hypothetical protein